MKFLQNCFVWLFVNLSWKSSVLSFSISSGSSDIGQTETIPARSGQNAPSINLECQLDFNANSGEKWTWCSWTHTFPDVWAYDNKEAFVMCSTTHNSDDGQVCEDQGNLVDDNYGGYYDPEQNPITHYDTTRLRFLVSERSCGLTIQAPHANDTGVWKCHVNDNNQEGQSTTMVAEVNLFVANESVVSITDPDLISNPGTSLEVDLTSSRADVDAECTAEYGVPPPEIIWYIDEPTNTVDQSVDQSIQSDGSVVSSIRLSLDQNSLSRYGIRMTNDYFSFALGCYPDQGDYFESKPQDYLNPAEVLVFGTSGAVTVTTSLVIVTVISLLLLQL